MPTKYNSVYGRCVYPNRVYMQNVFRERQTATYSYLNYFLSILCMTKAKFQLFFRKHKHIRIFWVLLHQKKSI